MISEQIINRLRAEALTDCSEDEERDFLTKREREEMCFLQPRTDTQPGTDVSFSGHSNSWCFFLLCLHLFVGTRTLGAQSVSAQTWLSSGRDQMCNISGASLMIPAAAAGRASRRLKAPELHCRGSALSHRRLITNQSHSLAPHSSMSVCESQTLQTNDGFKGKYENKQACFCCLVIVEARWVALSALTSILHQSSTSAGSEPVLYVDLWVWFQSGTSYFAEPEVRTANRTLVVSSVVGGEKKGWESWAKGSSHSPKPSMLELRSSRTPGGIKFKVFKF